MGRVFVLKFSLPSGSAILKDFIPTIAKCFFNNTTHMRTGIATMIPHGSDTGGVRFGGRDASPDEILNANHPQIDEIADSLDRVLKGGGIVTLLACCIGNPEILPKTQELAVALQRHLKVNSSLISVVDMVETNPAGREVGRAHVDWTTQGDWICVDPGLITPTQDEDNTENEDTEPPTPVDPQSVPTLLYEAPRYSSGSVQLIPLGDYPNDQP